MPKTKLTFPLSDKRPSHSMFYMSVNRCLLLTNPFRLAVEAVMKRDWAASRDSR